MSILIFNRKVLGRKLFAYKDWVEEADQKVVLFTQVDRPDLERYDHVEFIESFDATALTEIRALELDSEYAFTHIVVHSEYDLIRAAKLREFLGLPGQTVQSAVAYRDKVIMKEIARAAGIKVADFRRIESPVDLYRFASEKGFPVIVKPVDAGGARFIRVLNNMSELKSLLAAGLPPRFMVETFVKGDMYHADGIVKDGRVLFCAVSRYLYGCLAYQQRQSLGSYVVDPEQPIAKRVDSLVSEVIQAFPPTPVMAFHAEFFCTEDSELYLCEIASRTAGARVMETVESSYGVDIIKTWVRLQCDLPIALEPEFRGYYGCLIIPPREGKLEIIPESAPFAWTVDYAPTVARGQVLANPLSNGENIATALVVGETESSVERHLVELNDWFLDSVGWRRQSASNA